MSQNEKRKENSHKNRLLMAAPKKQPLYFVKHSAKMDGGGQLHVPAALLPEEVSGFPP